MPNQSEEFGPLPFNATNAGLHQRLSGVESGLATVNQTVKELPGELVKTLSGSFVLASSCQGRHPLTKKEKEGESEKINTTEKGRIKFVTEIVLFVVLLGFLIGSMAWGRATPEPAPVIRTLVQELLTIGGGS